MSATIADWLKAADTTAITLTPHTKSGGTLTATTPVITATGQYENFKVDLETETDQARPCTSTRLHHVPTVDSYSFEIDLLLLKAAEPDDLLAAILAGRYVLATFTRGGKSFTCYGLYVGVGFGTSGQGLQRTSARFVCIDTGSGPGYS